MKSENVTRTIFLVNSRTQLFIVFHAHIFIDWATILFKQLQGKDSEVKAAAGV